MQPIPQQSGYSNQTTRSPEIVKYLFPVIFGTLSLLSCTEEFRGTNDKHTQAIKEELSLFIDTVKGITTCQVWIPGKEGEPIIYFIVEVENEAPSIGKKSLVFAGEKALKIICLNDFIPPKIDDTVRIPYRLIDYIEYQTSNVNRYLGQEMTLYLSGPTGQNINH